MSRFRPNFETWCVYARHGSFRFVGRIALWVLGVDIPGSVQIGPGLILAHGGRGTVIHRQTKIGSRVVVYHNVTVGRAAIYSPHRTQGEVIIGCDVVLGPGSVVTFPDNGVRTLGDRCVIGANAVVVTDVPPNEIWAGSPARRVGPRPA